VHSVDSLKLAKYMHNVAADMGIRPRVLLQVNIGEEESKGGFSVHELTECFDEVLDLSQIEVVGLMCIPPAVMSGDFEVAIEEGATYVRVGTSIFGGR